MKKKQQNKTYSQMNVRTNRSVKEGREKKINEGWKEK